MHNYRKSLRFGFCLNPTASDPARPIQLARLAETMGLDYVGIQNLPNEPGSYNIWTLVSAIAATTSRITVIAKGNDLLSNSPLALATAAASLELLTEGRVVIELDVENFWASHPKIGRERSGNADALIALKEAIQIMHLAWSSTSPISFGGTFYSLDKVEPGPPPSRRISIWLDVKERNALSFIGLLAEGWIVSQDLRKPLDDLTTLGEFFDFAVTSSGRDPSELKRIWRIDDFNLDDDIGSKGDTFAQQWAERLADLALQNGIDTFLLMEGKNAELQLEKFSRGVIPRLRELVELSPDATITTGLSRSFQGAAASGITRAEEKTDDIDWVDETSMQSFPASDPPASNAYT